MIRHCAVQLVVLSAIATLGCDERVSPPAMDSVTTALRIERRRAFLADQEALNRELGRRALIFVEEPTVVAFYPADWPALDSTGWHMRVAQYRSVAAAAGWAYTERYSDHLRLFNQFQGGSYPVLVSPEAAGVLLVAPGTSPRLIYGDLAADELQRSLETLPSRVPGRHKPAAPGV